MKSYRRILVPIETGSRGEALLQRAAEIAQTGQAEVMVVKVINTRSGFEPDGPAGALPKEQAARKKPEARKRLDLMLARNKLGWAQARVICGDPDLVLADTITQWRPDLIVAAAGWLPRGWIAAAVARSNGAKPDVLTVESANVFARLAHAVLPHAASQA